MHRLVLKKQPTYITALAVLVFMSISTGFDFYSHAVSYYFYDTLLNHADLLFGEIVLPRYLLLSYLYEISSRIGIPIGYISLALIAFPIYALVSDTDPSIDHQGAESYSLVELLSFSLLLIISFFYSGASMVLLWLFALLKTKKPIFLLGALLHPIGILLFGVSSLLVDRKLFLRFFIVLALSMLFFYVCTYWSLFTSSTVQSPRFEIEFENTMKLLNFVVDKKSNEIIGAVIFVLLFLLSKRRLLEKVNILQRIRISKAHSNFILFLFVAIILLIMVNKNSLIKSVRTVDFHDVIYIAWFDWGEKNLVKVESPWTLNSKRYAF